ncbi:MAG: acyl-CoA/acyl-ACP dehydrogenase [Desulfobacterales bacterium]|jgi:3-oxocholest-4-en-26-oyl-CoA dehydrogenase beta subunit|nr:acyl-CoA/acyl-ACP dehydrogenase [Desulfobacteraceae bacterium]MBT4363946.1 acyl-CoA/acyl-ACP dehydrogenase [Desulfobacteraceae bacterium]MBT7085923.1 acyl-CoA/acyl-ACP dehydrogenase [Desulfobacterales bacterium]MBT7696889.1 acyl-CoA/acyl-ACP dehydrogenase [Desulfobacterales bacterium]
MDLDFNKEQKILKSSARDFLKKECPTSLIREMKNDKKGYSETLWNKMTDLGWMGVIIPEEYGGIGGSFLDLSILLEAMGEVCCPGPFFSTIVSGGLAILDNGSEDQKKALLPDLAEGRIILSLGLTEPGNWYGTENIAATAIKDKENYIIEGTKLFVENAHIADYILCAARTGENMKSKEGLTLFLVDSKTPGIKYKLLDTLAYDKQCEVIFDKVKVPEENIIGKEGQAWDILESLQEKAAVAKCAEMVGCIQTAFNMSVAYAKERTQFGKPIGAFQAVQHHCANMVIDVDGSRFITYKAAWKISEGLPASMEASMAKSWVSNASRKVTFLGHQIHGAISFCDEHDMHLFYRKAKAAETAFGDGNYHLEKVAGQLGL